MTQGPVLVNRGASASGRARQTASVIVSVYGVCFVVVVWLAADQGWLFKLGQTG